MQQIDIESPGPEVFEDCEEDYLDELRKGDWLGVPEYTVEMHILDRAREPKAGSAMLLRDKLSDLNMYAFFGDVPAQRRKRSKDYRRLDRELREKFGEGAVQREVYLDSLYGSLPESDHTSQQMQEAELNGLRSNFEVLDDIETAMEESSEFEVNYVDLRGNSKAGDLEAAYEDLQDSLALRISFEYTGDRDANRRFQSIGFDGEDFEGIPGFVTVNGAVETNVPVAEKVDLDDKRIERWVEEMIE